MRITNPMMSSKMSLNINRNMTRLDNLYAQWASGKKIQFPSGSPIIASRALKFRTTVAENVQYQRNAEQGLSWMEVSESGYHESINILKKIRELTVQGDGAESMEDKHAMATQINSLLEQMGLTMNSSYTGRYLYSGYRTDEPGTILKEESMLSFTDITQTITGNNIENIKAFQKPNAAGEPIITDASVIKLPYKYVTFPSTSGADITVDGTALPAGKLTTKQMADIDAYKPANDEIYYIEETGELVLGSDYVNAKEFEVCYDKSGFKKGDLNPKVYFTCTDSAGNTFTMDDQNMEYEFGVGTKFPVNSLAKDIITSEMYADIMNFCDTVLNTKVSDRADVIAALRTDTANDNKSYEELSNMAEAQIVREKEKIETTLQQKFSNMIATVDKHTAALSKSQTDLGVREARLELIRNRLESDETAYTKLMSENEDANLVEVAMILANAESVYQASLQIGMNMIQTSLANFL